MKRMSLLLLVFALSVGGFGINGIKSENASIIRGKGGVSQKRGADREALGAQEGCRMALCAHLFSEDGLWGFRACLKGTLRGGKWIDKQMRVERGSCPLLDANSMLNAEPKRESWRVKWHPYIVVLQKRRGPYLSEANERELIGDIRFAIVEFDEEGGPEIKVSRLGNSIDFIDGQDKRITMGIVTLRIASMLRYEAELIMAGLPPLSTGWQDGIHRESAIERLAYAPDEPATGFGECFVVTWENRRPIIVSSRMNGPEGLLEECKAFAGIGGFNLSFKDSKENKACRTNIQPGGM